MSQTINTTIGLSANGTSPGQLVHFKSPHDTNVTITNNSGQSVQYAIDGATWVTVANGAAASVGTVSAASQFRLRKTAGDSYPVPVQMSWTTVDGEFDPSNAAITGGIVGSMNIVTLSAGSEAAAAANAAVLQAAITAGQGAAAKTIAVLTPGVYYVAQVVVPSFTNLYVGEGVTLRKPANTPAAMFINAGALQATPTTDSDIGFYGPGTLDGNAANQSALTQATTAAPGANTFLYGVQGEVSMIGVNNFVFSVGNAYNCNGFVVQWIGQYGRVENVSCNTARDFLHINGPSSHLLVRNCTGFSSDVFIALNAWDWHRSGPTVGDITDVRISGCAYYGSNNVDGNSARTSGLLALLPGTRTTGYGTGTANVKNVSVDGYVIDATKGSVTAASPSIQPSMAKDSIQGSEYSGVGLIENIKLSNGYVAVPNSNTPGVALVSQNISADGQCTTTVRNFVIESTHFDASMSAAGNDAIIAATPFNFWNVIGLRVKDCEWTPNASASGQKFINWGNKTTADSISIDGLVINAAATAATPILVNQYSAGNASTVSDLTLDRLQTAAGVQLTNAWLTVNGVITNLRSRGCYLVGTGSGNDDQGIYLNSATAQIVSGVLSDGYFNGTKELLMVNNGVAAAATLSVQNCVLKNVTHPVFVNAAVAVDVSFRGGSIDTSSNLARLANAGGTMTLSYSDTTSSGTGATTITAASAGVVRVRNSDRIQLPVGLTATNPPTPQNNDVVNFAGTPSYTGSNVVSGTLAGLYTYRGTGTVGWVKLN